MNYYCNLSLRRDRTRESAILFRDFFLFYYRTFSKYYFFNRFLLLLFFSLLSSFEIIISLLAIYYFFCISFCFYLLLLFGAIPYSERVLLYRAKITYRHRSMKMVFFVLIFPFQNDLSILFEIIFI